MRNSPAIAAATEMNPGRYPEYDHKELHKQVTTKFISEWNVKPQDINGVLAYPAGIAQGTGAEIFIHEEL